MEQALESEKISSLASKPPIYTGDINGKAVTCAAVWSRGLVKMLPAVTSGILGNQSSILEVTNMRDIRRLDLEAHVCKEPVVAQYFTVLQDARKRTKDCIRGLSEAALSWRPSAGQSNIADLLYHIALVEADWLYDDVLGIEYPDPIKAWFPEPMRDAHGILIHRDAETLEKHLVRLDSIRAELLKVFADMDLREFRRVRSLPKYDVTPEWVLHHLAQHEAEHRGQIRVLRKQAEAVKRS